MRPLTILHIEDSEEDLILFQRACEAAGLPAVFHPILDGLTAIAYLKGKANLLIEANIRCPRSLSWI